MSIVSNALPKGRLSDGQLEELTDSGEVRRFAAGEAIFHAGDRGDSMFVVVEGAVELRFHDSRPVKRLETGAFFGELSLLFGSHRRTATAKAAKECALRVLGQPAFDRLLETRPALLVSILRRSTASLLASERALVEDLEGRNRELHRALLQLRITEKRLTDAELAANTDPLTELFNRRFLEERVDRLLDRAREARSGLALLLADLDGFKEINDTHGHVVGDEVLRRMSELLKLNLRATDLPCRIGGDEFAVILPDIDEVEAERRARELHEKIGTYRLGTGEAADRVTVSLGGATYRNGESWKTFFKRADHNLYLAKKAGRRRLSWNGVVAPEEVISWP